MMHRGPGLLTRAGRGRGLSFGLLVTAALALGAGACEAPPPASAGIATQSSAIVGGTADTTDSAVMALVHQEAAQAEACSGTVIAIAGASGIFLTAGHCVVASDSSGHITTPISVASPSDLFVIPGPDWSAQLNMGLYYGVAAVTVHPSYTGAVNDPFDIALVRFVGATPATPVIPALAPADDTLATGSAFTLVGFGKTQISSTAADMNSARREVGRTVASLTTNQFEYTQTDDKGACSGDSGGPALVQTANGLRVAGVTSFGDPNCDVEGVSVRVSPVSAFIQSFIAQAPATLDCQDCTLAVVGPGNPCVAEGEACGDQTTSCGQFLACADACQTNSCVTTCENRFAAGVQAYQAMVTCQCGSCTSVCANDQNCGGSGTGAGGSSGTGTAGSGGGGSSGVLPVGVCGGVSDPRPACDACIQSQCCDEGTACSNDPVCSSCLQEDAPTCKLNTALSNLTNCIATCPGCASATTDAGATGTAGSGAGGSASGETAASKSGCGCVAGGSGGAPSPASLVGLAVVVLLGRRARRRKRVAGHRRAA
jgi:MYXO-CTERM domain-containing protein